VVAQIFITQNEAVIAGSFGARESIAFTFVCAVRGRNSFARARGTGGDTCVDDEVKDLGVCG
jgi:hypothetical protein